MLGMPTYSVVPKISNVPASTPSNPFRFIENLYVDSSI
jgi:hypothetical protein